MVATTWHNSQPELLMILGRYSRNMFRMASPFIEDSSGLTTFAGKQLYDAYILGKWVDLFGVIKPRALFSILYSK